MEPLLKIEREGSLFVPYRFGKTDWEFFLQKRDASAPTGPSLFGTFGGGIESGETPEDAFFREVKEELVYRPSKVRYLGKIQTFDRLFYVFIEEVGTDFQQMIEIKEGEYGKFLSANEVAGLREITDSARLIVSKLQKYLKRTK